MYILKSKIGDFEATYLKMNLDAKEVEHYYDPSKADEFSTIKEAQDWADKYCSETEYVSVVEIKDALRRYANLLKEGFKQGSWKIKSQTHSRRYNNESPEEVLAWHIVVKHSGTGAISYKDYASWPNLYQVFECIFSTHTYIDRTKKVPEHWLSFQMCVRPFTKFETFKKELELVVPKITYINDEGAKVIDIFDYKLSEDGGVDFLIHPDGSYSIEDRFDTLVKGDLKTVFDFWQKERYYN